MRYFLKITEGVEIHEALERLDADGRIWEKYQGRQQRIDVQRHTQSVYLRAAVRRPDVNMNENQESEPTAEAQLFPSVLEFMERFAASQNCELSRAMLVRLMPRARVGSHVDVGSYYRIRRRYHLVLRSSAGSILRSGGEEVLMREGELWWFDNSQYHEAANVSDEWRIHLIFDLLPFEYKHMAVNPTPVFCGVDAEALRKSAIGTGPSTEARATAKQTLLEILRRRCMLDGRRRILVGPNGRPNSWLLDVRRAFLDQALLNSFATLFCDRYADRWPFQVGGMEMAAIPLVTAVVIEMARRGKPVNGFLVRKERKTYGAAGRIEGGLTADPIIIIDDIIHSGASLEKVRVVLEAEQRRKIAEAFVLVDYGSLAGMEWRQRQDVKVESVFGMAELGLRKRTRPRAGAFASFENIWRFRSPNPNLFHVVPKSFPATDGNRIYFGSDGGTLWSLKANDGAVAWSFDVRARGHKNIWSAPVLFEDRLFFGGYDGNVYCLDKNSGRELWRFNEADWVGSSPAIAPELGLIFIGLEYALEGRAGAIAALDMNSGEKVWSIATKRYTHGSPAYWADRKLVACGSNDDELFLIDATTGTQLWRFQTRGKVGGKGSIRHAPAFDTRRERVVTGAADGYVYIVDVNTGKEVWSVRTENSIYTVPLVVGDTAYVGSTDKHLYVLDLEACRVKAKIYAKSKIFGPPKLLMGRIYFGACSGIVYEMDPVSNAVTGKHQLPDAVTNALTCNADAGHLYALTYANELVAFRRVA
jgi:outer membrane protein assembly factor BamB/orotate phosphoribosyltransferase